MADEERLDLAFALRQAVYAHATLAPDRANQGHRQQGDAQTRTDTAYNGLECAELEVAHAYDPAPRQQGFEVLAI